MTRRCLLGATAVACLRGADAEEQAYELVTAAAARLSDGDAFAFIELFDPEMPGYRAFSAMVTGLLQEADVQSSVELLRNEGGPSERALDLDWRMQVKLRGTGEVVRRREAVKCRVRKLGRRWKFTSVEPRSLFAPVALKRPG